MNRFMMLVAALTYVGLCTSLAAHAAQPPAKYIPVGVYYMHGNLVNVKAYPEQSFDSLKECVENLQRSILEIKQDGKIPEGGEMMGACLPVPATQPTATTPPSTDKGTAREPVSNL